MTIDDYLEYETAVALRSLAIMVGIAVIIYGIVIL